MERLTLTLHLNTLAPMQYDGYDFASLAAVDGVPMGGGEDGLFELHTGDADVIDPADAENGTRPIAAFFELLRSDLGDPRNKRVRHLLVAGETDGAIVATVTFDEQRSFSETLRPATTDQYQDGLQGPGSRRVKGRHIAIRIDNVAGCDFSVDAISPYVAYDGHRRGA